MTDYRAECFVAATDLMERSRLFGAEAIDDPSPFEAVVLNLLQAQVMATLACAPVEVVLCVRELLDERAKLHADRQAKDDLAARRRDKPPFDKGQHRR